MRLVTAACLIAASTLACASDDLVAATPAPSSAASGGSGGSDAAGAGGSGGSGGAEPQGPTRGDCGPTAWSARYGGSHEGQSLAEERARSVALDASGNVYVGGIYRGDVDLGGGPLVAGQDNHSMFLAKLAPDGSHLWSKGFGDSSDGVFYAPSARVHALAATADGGVVMVGSFAGVIDFGAGPLASADEAAMPPSVPGGCLLSCQSDIVIARFDASGELVWAQHHGATGGDSARDVALDAAGNIYVTGYFNGSIDFGGGVLTEAGQGFTDGFVLGLDPEGQHMFSMRFGGENDDFGSGIAVDSETNLVVVGSFTGNGDFGAVQLGAGGEHDGYVMKLDALGTVLWVEALSATTRAVLLDVAVSPSGDYAVTGAFRGDLTLAGETLDSAYDDVLVAGFDAEGNATWSRAYGGVQNDAGSSVAFAPDGSLVVAGAVSADAVDFGGGVIAGGVSDDLFLLELDESLAHVCSRRYGGVGIDGSSAAHSIALDPASGAVMIGGSMAGSVDFGAGTLMADHQLDILLARFE